ncbi:hypothetical protein Clacol_007301 [Clathrus columnatus]|uniref:TauD/TfdA-like domain-containing protein n=1 Tax=Clathrus columnatus TaxID=1419009 RepID=A0AAV5AEI7_9AGAM|nr:hypothetical protein Clacol_007301 [Clathrus columnatus]
MLNRKQDLHRAFSQLIRYGLVFLTGVPIDKTDDLHCEVRRMGEIFGRIRETFYGQVWDVISVRNSTNIANTNLDLGLHMDLLYFQHPPRYQILHCLRNKVEGGTSYFVDAIRSAEILRVEKPEYFKVLTRVPVPYHYINDGHHLHNHHPVIQLSQTDESNIEYINYSPPFQAPLLVDTPPEFYHALHRFSELLDTEADTYRHTLQEGEAVVFDNRRVLHARTEFNEKEAVPEGEASRWLKGCYLEADDILDRQRILLAQLD